MVNQNGRTYWVPFSDRDNVSISSYHKWELAFRVFSNVYTSVHADCTSELLQYHHLIFSASQNYIWDNVYTYDIDFRLHISKPPERSWGLILQQAWSFRLKDRLTYFRSNQGQGANDKGGSSNYSNNGNNRFKRICHNFNQGHCEYGLSCKFEHRCGICGKFGHGTVNCRRGRRFQSGGSHDQDRRNDRYHYNAGKEQHHYHKSHHGNGGKKEGKH